MASSLRLTVTDYAGPTHWRWLLSDGRGRFLADHTVNMDPTSRECAGLLDVNGYLDYHRPITPPEAQLAELGVWIGEHVFGGVREALWQRRALPAVVVNVAVPAVGQELLLRPLELARFADGTTFQRAGMRFIYQLDGVAAPVAAKAPSEPTLRILGVFSLPSDANPLNLRRERYGLQRLVRELSQTQCLCVDLRVLQYGATRDTLRDALEEAEGWDVIHISCHGREGNVLLEDDRGAGDEVGARELGDLLEPTRQRLKLLVLDSCLSAAGTHAAARMQLGLETQPKSGIYVQRMIEFPHQ